VADVWQNYRARCGLVAPRKQGSPQHLSSPQISEKFSSPIVSSLDGDTIEVLHNNRAERIRLKGIDCPEKGQVYGKRAKHAASELVFGKEVTLQTYGKDKHGRTIADALLPHGTNVNHTLVKHDWCWWWRRRILIVDDDPDARQFLIECLEGVSDGTQAARTGWEDFSQIGSEEFDGVVLDIGLPELDGLQV